MISVIIPAGGSGKRMGRGGAKIYRNLLGKPILIRSLEAFQAIGGIEEIILVLPPKSISSAIRRFGAAFQRLGVAKIAPGGLTRQGSVASGLGFVERSAKWVMVHDAARPLVSRAEVRALIRGAKRTGAAVLGVPLRDTVKRTSRNKLVTNTLNRAYLWRVLTPQLFKYKILRDAHGCARGVEATDDASLVERRGGRVLIVEGSPENLKITVPQDIRRAELILRARRKKLL